MLAASLWKKKQKSEEGMPLFLSEDEYERCSHDASVVAEKADAFIRELYNQLETVKAQADAAAITAEQTCSLLEQKYVSLTSEFAKLESQNSQLNSTLEQHLSELAQVQSLKHHIHLKSVILFRFFIPLQVYLGFFWGDIIEGGVIYYSRFFCFFCFLGIFVFPDWKGWRDWAFVYWSFRTS